MAPQDQHHRRDDLRIPSGDPPIVADEPVTVAPTNAEDGTATAGGSDTDAGIGAGGVAVGTGLGTNAQDAVQDDVNARRPVAAESRTPASADDGAGTDRAGTSHQVVQAFVDALGRLERDRDLEPMVALFGSTCRLRTILDAHEWIGPDGARAFWERYRDSFGDVRSTFQARLTLGDRAALEWATEATTVTGEPLRYDGACFLDLDGGAIVGFRAYFSPAALGR